MYIDNTHLMIAPVGHIVSQEKKSKKRTKSVYLYFCISIIQNVYISFVFSRMADRLSGRVINQRRKRRGRKGKRRWGQAAPRLGHFDFVKTGKRQKQWNTV